jgi:hypothetical protein
MANILPRWRPLTLPIVEALSCRPVLMTRCVTGGARLSGPTSPLLHALPGSVSGRSGVIRHRALVLHSLAWRIFLRGILCGADSSCSNHKAGRSRDRYHRF